MNRRQYFRVWARLTEAWVTRLEQGAVQRFPVRVLNLSGGGAMIIAPPRIRNGDHVCLELPRRFGYGPLALRGEIVWTDTIRSTCRAGIRFAISEQIRDEVIRIVFAQELRSAG